jgi:hypothetical protein
MRKLLFFLLFAVPVAAQVSNPSIVPVAAPPTSCPVIPAFIYQAGSTLYISGPGNTCVALTTGSSIFTPGGDLGGTATSQTVLGLMHVTNAAIPAAITATPSVTVAAGGFVGSANTGSPKFTFGTNQITTPSGVNFGIGTTSPSQLLTVGNSNQFYVTSAGGVNAAGQVSSAGYNTSFSDIYLWAGGLFLGSSRGVSWSNSATANGTQDAGIYRLSAGVLAVGNGTVGNATGTLIAGNVGIGTTSPGSRLTVKGGDAFVDGTATGLILRDTVVTTNCYRITIASGLVTPTLVTCPTD